MYDGEVPESAKYVSEHPGKLVNSGLSIGSRLPLSPQEKAIAELHETISQLAGRLKPVLTPVNQTTEREPGTEAKETASPLADQLHANNKGIQRASESLRAIMERLEC
jgi:uncharacterized coiled-coil protein SlyX